MCLARRISIVHMLWGVEPQAWLAELAHRSYMLRGFFYFNLNVFWVDDMDCRIYCLVHFELPLNGGNLVAH